MPKNRRAPPGPLRGPEGPSGARRGPSGPLRGPSGAPLGPPDFWCNRHCRTSPVVLEGFWGPSLVEDRPKPEKSEFRVANEPLSKFVGFRRASMTQTPVARPSFRSPPLGDRKQHRATQCDIAVLKAEIKIKNPRIRPESSPKPASSLGKCLQTSFGFAEGRLE